jgi:hypothetical protein
VVRGFRNIYPRAFGPPARKHLRLTRLIRHLKKIPPCPARAPLPYFESSFGGHRLVLPESSSNLLHAIRHATPTKMEPKKISCSLAEWSGTNAATAAAVNPMATNTLRSVRLNTKELYSGSQNESLVNVYRYALKQRHTRLTWELETGGQISVENRDYHYLSQSEIDGGKRSGC